MKDIDLTKCVNLRAKVRAKTYDRKEEFTTVGRIEDNGGIEGEFLLHTDDNEYVDLFYDGKMDENIIDFEIVPRDPETYRDWQVGDIVCEKEFKNAHYEVIFRSGELVVFKDWNNWVSNPMTCSEAFTRFGMRLVLTDIEQQIIEERKEYEPQAGDIVAWKDKENDGRPAISIYRKKNRAYFTLFVDGMTGGLLHNLAMNIVRPATDEEKQLLFDAMAKQGKRWNAEKKVVEDIPKPHEFKKGELVLVRSDYGRDWVLCVYVERSSNSDVQFGQHIVTNGETFLFYRFCIPYNERTMHLLGTSEDYREGE